MQMLVECAIARRFLRDQHGATSIEYALIAGGIAVAIVTSVHAIGPVVRSLFEATQAGFNF